MKYRYWLFVGLILVILMVAAYMIEREGQSDVDPKLAVGQNLIVGVQGPDLDAANISYLETVKPGAIILYKYNIRGNELKSFIDQLQSIALRTTGVRYLIMIDEEPGGATRLGLFQDAFGAAGPDWEVVTRDVQKLHQLGINVVLSPLVDLPIDSKGSVTHRLPLHSPQELTSFNSKFIEILHQNGIGATLKHFPGLGLLENDTHIDITHSKASPTDIAEEVALFKSGADAGADFVMTSHGIYDAIDPTRSASVSKKAVDLLRTEANFRGIAITDDITNMPIGDPERMQPYDASVEALRAGHNMIMLGFRRPLTLEIYNQLLEAYKSDRKLKRIIDQNYLTVLNYKNSRTE